MPKHFKMKKIFAFAVAGFLSASLMAQPPKGDANKGMTFGETITTEGSITSDALVKKLDKENKLEVKVEGEVAQVCAAEGCWLKMKTANGTILVKMKDHKFLVPLSMNAKTIVAKGIAEKKITSIEMQKHYAEDAGKSKEEIEAIKEPKQEIVLQATGIVVVK